MEMSTLQVAGLQVHSIQYFCEVMYSTWGGSHSTTRFVWKPSDVTSGILKKKKNHQIRVFQ